MILKKDVKKYDDNNKGSFLPRHLVLSNQYLYYMYNSEDKDPIVKIPINMIESIESFPVINSLK